MGETTGIEWTDATVNFWWGCTKVGPGCDHCYAETWSERFGGGLWGVGAPRRKIKGALKLLYRLRNDYSWWSADHYIGRINPTPHRRVFIQSMSDLFDKEVPQEWFDEAWGAITACSDMLDIQIVTKRLSFVEKRLGGKPWPERAGLIISVVNQEEADRDLDRLRELKTRLGIPWVGLSIEPMLGPIVADLTGIDWVIVGGESGKNARPLHPDWARSLRDQCVAAGKPFFFKQWGEFVPCITDDNGEGLVTYADGADCEAFTEPRRHPIVTTLDREFWRVGKKTAGRLLDGREWNELPNIDRKAT